MRLSPHDTRSSDSRQDGLAKWGTVHNDRARMTPTRSDHVQPNFARNDRSARIGPDPGPGSEAHRCTPGAVRQCGGHSPCNRIRIATGPAYWGKTLAAIRRCPALVGPSDGDRPDREARGPAFAVGRPAIPRPAGED